MGLRTNGVGLILLIISVHAEVLEAFLIVFSNLLGTESFPRWFFRSVLHSGE